MITTLVTAVHVFACVALILIVLLQAGKGAEMGVSFGGGASQALLGSSGDTPMIGKITTGIAIIFMLTSLSLAYMSGHPKSKSVMDKSMPVKAQTAEGEKKAETPATQTPAQEATKQEQPAAPKAEATTQEAPVAKEATQPSSEADKK